jgi:hypothetical protein
LSSSLFRNPDELKKLVGAMKTDSQDRMLASLTTLQHFADIPLKITVRNPATPDKGVEIIGRPLRDREIIEYWRKLAAINQRLAVAQDPSEVQLTPEELEKVQALFDEYIQLSTGIPTDFLKDLGDSRIRHQLFRGIMIGSQPKVSDVEASKKFRPE